VAATPIPKPGQADRERRARYIGEWLKTEARYLASWPNPAASRRLGRSTIPIRNSGSVSSLTCAVAHGVFHRSASVLGGVEALGSVGRWSVWGASCARAPAAT